MEESLKSFMTADPVTIAPDASALEALGLIRERRIRHLMVVDPEERLVGVLTWNDLRAALPAAVDPQFEPDPALHAQASEHRVDALMTPDPITLSVAESLGDAADRMADSHIGCLPIVESDGRLVGIVTETDALRALGTTLWVEAHNRKDDQERDES